MRRFLARLRYPMLGALTAACLLLLTVCACMRIWSYRDYCEYEAISAYAPGKALWFGHIQAGMDLNWFVAVFPPDRIDQRGRYTHLAYWSSRPAQGQGLLVLAKDGYLIHADVAERTWGRVFFESKVKEPKAKLLTSEVYEPVQ
jgi:hypothetical protein